MGLMPELESQREKINRIDRAIVSLLDKRFSVARAIGKIKIENNLPILNAARERKVLAKIKCMSKNQEAVKRIFHKIMAESRTVQEELK